MEMVMPENNGFRAMCASRWRFAPEGAVGRWWYTVLVEGGRGGRYEVELTHRDGGARPLPFKVTRLGQRSCRKLGWRGGELKTAIEETARAALEV
jgi:hypothetical protein